ncbi:AI-2E family transporter [Fusobacterium sp. MFO224]|uniref:AI-2E family transporter n=1 Tax=Fusobacterium sp. MFO224 TaxID=3378070 RepID=UPI0038533E38
MKIKKLMPIFFLGVFIIIVQTLFQNTSSLTNILQITLSYIRPFIYAIFIAIIINPMVEFIEKRLKFSKTISLITSLIIIFILFIGVIFLIIPSIIDSFKEIYNQLPMFQRKFIYYLEKLLAFLKEKNLLIMNINEVEKTVEDFFIKNISNIRDFLLSFGLNVIDLIIETFIFLLGGFIAMYFIMEKSYFMDFIKKIIFLLFDKEKSEKGFKFLIQCKNIFLKYLQGRVIVSVAVGVIAYIVMIIFHVPYASINAFMLGVGNMIPYFGSLVAGTIAFILVVLINPIKVLYVFLAIFIAQMADGYIIGPRILGESVGLSSFWIIASIIIMGNVMGTLGMFLGVPLFAILKLIYTNLIKKKEKQVKLYTEED